MLNLGRVNSCLAYTLKCFQVPVLDCFICWTNSQCQCLRIVLQARYWVPWARLMLGKGVNDFTGVNFPEFSISISSSRCDPSSIRGNWKISNNFIMSWKSNNCLIIAGSKIPNLDISIVRCGSDKVWILIICNARNLCFVPGQYICLLPVKIPHIYGSTVCSRKEILT